MELLTAPVKTLRYLPEIDYDMDSILQNFGQPDETIDLENGIKKLVYVDSGISIYLNEHEQV